MCLFHTLLSKRVYSHRDVMGICVVVSVSFIARLSSRGRLRSVRVVVAMGMGSGLHFRADRRYFSARAFRQRRCGRRRAAARGAVGGGRKPGQPLGSFNASHQVDQG